MFVRKDLIDVREKFIIYLSCCCPPSFVSSLRRKLDDFMVGSKQQTPNLLELEVSLGQNQDAEWSRSSMFSEQEYSELSYWMQLPIIGGS